MKKLFIVIIIVVLIAGGVGVYTFIKNKKEEARIAEIKKGWYIEVTYDEPINVRVEPSKNSNHYGTVKKGEVYKVLDVDLNNTSLYWYKIEYGKHIGWVASLRKKPWVKDVNNPNDIAVPQIKYTEDVYTVATIDDINYKHLEVVEDTDVYTITHTVYHEVVPSRFIDQYWILYTITDGAGKSSSKMQKIEFQEKPDESKVEDFSKYKR